MIEAIFKASKRGTRSRAWLGNPVVKERHRYLRAFLDNLEKFGKRVKNGEQDGFEHVKAEGQRVEYWLSIR